MEIPVLVGRSTRMHLRATQISLSLCFFSFPFLSFLKWSKNSLVASTQIALVRLRHFTSFGKILLPNACIDSQPRCFYLFHTLPPSGAVPHAPTVSFLWFALHYLSTNSLAFQNELLLFTWTTSPHPATIHLSGYYRLFQSLCFQQSPPLSSSSTPFNSLPYRYLAIRQLLNRFNTNYFCWPGLLLFTR